VAVQQHHPRRRDIQRQAHQGGAQDHGRENREVERPLGRHRDQDHDQRQHDIEGEQHVQQHRRQRQHDHAQQRDQEHRGRELVPPQLADEGVNGIHQFHALASLR